MPTSPMYSAQAPERDRLIEPFGRFDLNAAARDFGRLHWHSCGRVLDHRKSENPYRMGCKKIERRITWLNAAG